MVDDVQVDLAVLVDGLNDLQQVADGVKRLGHLHGMETVAQHLDLPEFNELRSDWHLALELTRQTCRLGGQQLRDLELVSRRQRLLVPSQVVLVDLPADLVRSRVSRRLVPLLEQLVLGLVAAGLVLAFEDELVPLDVPPHVLVVNSELL